jgi:hypothetical protein
MIQISFAESAHAAVLACVAVGHGTIADDLLRSAIRGAAMIGALPVTIARFTWAAEMDSIYT